MASLLQLERRVEALEYLICELLEYLKAKRDEPLDLEKIRVEAHDSLLTRYQSGQGGRVGPPPWSGPAEEIATQAALLLAEAEGLV